MTKEPEKLFGATVRQRREEHQLGLREMAKMISISPTYLSKSSETITHPPQKTKSEPLLNSLILTPTNCWDWPEKSLLT